MPGLCHVTAEIFQLSLPFFEGPMEVLAREVERQKVKVADLPLAAITEQYAEYALSSDNIDLGDAGYFLATAARLLYLKSSHLLSAPEEDDEISEEASFACARGQIRSASALLASREGCEAFSAAPHSDIPRLIQPHPASLLPRIFAEVSSRAHRQVLRVVVAPFMRLEEAIAGLTHRLASGHTVWFSHLRRTGGTRDVVVHFLAVLELVRRKEAVAVQHDLFSDIAVEPVAGQASEVRAG